jgi:hypothetical protein
LGPESTAFSNHAIELSLAHSIGNAVEKSYRRGDMFTKRKLMEAWSIFYTSEPPANAETGNVVPMGGGR